MNIAEVGVWKGEGAKQMVAHWPEATLWLFDSFCGHSTPSEFDNAVCHPRGRYSDTSLNEVMQKYPRANIIPGYVPETFQDFYFEPLNAVRFKFVRIDLDHYWPTLEACMFFKSRMTRRGIIEFDDYRHPECPGATKAIDEVFGRDNVLPGEGNFPTNSYHWVST